MPARFKVNLDGPSTLAFLPLGFGVFVGHSIANASTRTRTHLHTRDMHAYALSLDMQWRASFAMVRNDFKQFSPTRQISATLRSTTIAATSTTGAVRNKTENTERVQCRNIFASQRSPTLRHCKLQHLNSCSFE